MPRTALYTGTFDPVTNGHLDVVRRAARIADKVVVAAGIHSSKTPIFTVEERLEMLREACAPAVEEAGAEFEVATFSGLAIEAARRHGATIIVRGLRDGTDLDYEMQMGAMNETMAPDIHTVFVPASPAVRPITATLVRQVAQMGGDVSAFVPPGVARRIEARFQSRR
ncbi:pantetheine-phosphate adenylyltransferase [Enterovirga aerilata]|uniref:Phosphopantetheine adenylyltransferase n=1 Tax=Enterovirga aerilata TaxID=2730920 RepID=A0A849I4P8_9HYPH|nr:pantetheine-phosphate adenylyltransferase [Enterovirga sp. DB1703]NNM72301.1 pantetheine-phosphate adenylyltransferase [Enterovirga sp. DB1703]